MAVHVSTSLQEYATKMLYKIQIIYLLTLKSVIDRDTMASIVYKSAATKFFGTTTESGTDLISDFYFLAVLVCFVQLQIDWSHFAVPKS